ncbi:L-glutamate gamma-semialdehyde dehydrogenase [Paenibacillus urinalis]|uniref:L-glutamate gamma-semialdehyde dehydrogenase n=1 Tax=Paenibacillus urinalis TaxID=521520 RepID=A0AAX3N5L8_9BACL|nr:MULTISPECIES: L-glutamate gamma-semialdehyde dehydrogenase [Paenibacillus]WDH84661.1 L-glutamate gamma-semialdehyde dehydrogenase [Paenibacillus urinalis]WDH96123.1 L-glutamate gamma-semialdehyde dehydrogenase [Paenibacillus urinalis]WDI04344.1 L-glutamate gamma-semialdehyde dehydrogenase [Paenibacillus urinalis]GAK38322.1 protein RocA [Paenibacillus sp. TCA20]
MNKTANISPFVNEPFVNFSLEENKQAMEKAISKVKSELGQNIPLHIGEKKVFTEEVITSVNPGNLGEVIGYVSKANQPLAEEAMQIAVSTFETWKRVPPRERAEYLFKAATLMRERKHEFSALMILESGKNYAEADADTAEAIDFIEFYAREILRIDQINEIQPLTKVQGEDNRLTYIPLGVGVIIPPWNFPLAICVGMTTAAVVSGNTVLLKPASTTPAIAHKFVALMEEVGLPAGVINFIPGSGAEVGDYLTSHPKTRFISFTGSKEVGLHISKQAADTSEGQIWIKRLIAEMGGKDGIVVDETANLDAAAQAIVASAFGFQGQKCSAGSRAIIVEAVYDEVVEKVKELTEKLAAGLPELNYPAGPVIDKASYDKILNYIQIGKGEGTLLTGGSPAEGNGYYIQPTVFADVKPDARIMKEEIFGPVLAICKASDYKEAIEIYNDTEFGLTGSYFSSDQDRIEEALETMHCGNLYINRKCTGALVGAHPFGGFNMSGTDSKAGGYDYLLLFTQAKLTSRKL